MLKEFKQFLLRGNVVDLAVGVVAGASFSTVINALVKDIITPLISAIVKIPELSNISFTINESKFLIGDFINALISFFLISAAVFFMIVKPMNVLIDFSKRIKNPVDPTTKRCEECLSEIPIKAKRCAHCGQAVK